MRTVHITPTQVWGLPLCPLAYVVAEGPSASTRDLEEIR